MPRDHPSGRCQEQITVNAKRGKKSNGGIWTITFNNPFWALENAEMVDEKDHFKAYLPQIGRLMTNSIFSRQNRMDYIY